MIKKILCINKPLGKTPIQAIDMLRGKYPQYRNINISHAGKLDPMAEGVLLLVTNPNTQILKENMKLDKVYRAKILFGFSSDSYDIQGIPELDPNLNFDLDNEKIRPAVEGFRGSYMQETPVFSGRKVKGKPLYYYARKGKLSKIEIPKVKVYIKDISINSIDKISKFDLKKQVINKINLLSGDFRQEEIIGKWTELLDKVSIKEFKVIDVTIICSSGTYIRAIANDLGKKLDSKALLLGLIRLKVGDYFLKDCINV